MCLDWNTGEVKWETTWENKGSIVFADGMFYLYEEKRGNVGLLLPDPEKIQPGEFIPHYRRQRPPLGTPFYPRRKMFSATEKS